MTPKQKLIGIRQNKQEKESKKKHKKHRDAGTHFCTLKNFPPKKQKVEGIISMQGSVR